MQYLLNAIPGALIPPEGININFFPVGPMDVPADVHSAIGHADTAAVVSSILGRDVPAARVNVPMLQPGQSHFLALYQGPRLPEGATQLPAGATLSLYKMTAH